MTVLGFPIGWRSRGLSSTFTETEPPRGFGWSSTSMCLMWIIRVIRVRVTFVFVHPFIIKITQNEMKKKEKKEDSAY